MKTPDSAPMPFKKEPSILDSLENQVALFHKLGAVYANRPEMSSFVGSMQGTRFENHYTAEQVLKDQEYVKDRRSKIENQNSSEGKEHLDRLEGGFQLSEILQAMIVDRMNKNWFTGCTSIMTSDYDDLAVGIDAIMKHERGGILGTSFDFTVSNKDMIIYKKLEKEWDDHIKDGKVVTVKYFQDPDTKEKKSLIVPRFIVSASKKDVEELATAYLNDDTETLQNHPFKYVMLLQLEEQLQTVLDYYAVNDAPELAFAKMQYERIQTLLRFLKQEIHIDDKMHEGVDLYEYTKENIGLNMMRRFHVMRSQPPKSN